ncbi:single-stranded DNA-binding protein [Corticicoccus populi]|uniref:Single-stranded DNA-binding protein n=1 Tax=Corticicoccus populi TaxID=1812821 RepID=A0ABW5WX00_9STAP
MAKNEKKLLKKAWKETKSLHEGETFLLKDLFKGYKWNRLAIEQRVVLGRLFLEKVKDKKSVQALEKNSSNQQVYQKMEE